MVCHEAGAGCSEYLSGIDSTQKYQRILPLLIGIDVFIVATNEVMY
jgi:hypothetical protein